MGISGKLIEQVELKGREELELTKLKCNGRYCQHLMVNFGKLDVIIRSCEGFVIETEIIGATTLDYKVSSQYSRKCLLQGQTNQYHRTFDGKLRESLEEQAIEKGAKVLKLPKY